MSDDSLELPCAVAGASHLLKICTRPRKSGDQAQKRSAEDRMRRGISQLLNSFEDSFPVLSLAVAILSWLLIAMSTDFPHAIFFPRHSHAQERSSVLEAPLLLTKSILPFQSTSRSRAIPRRMRFAIRHPSFDPVPARP
jgi:hypothetical protein